MTKHGTTKRGGGKKRKIERGGPGDLENGAAQVGLAVAEAEKAPVPRLIENAILQFARVLRCLGIRVGSAEVLDALRGLSFIQPLERRQFRTLLRSTLVKSTDHLGVFDLAFDLFFVPPEAREQRLAAREAEQERVAALVQRAEEELVFQGRPLNLDEKYKEIYAQLERAEQERLLDFLDKTSTGHKVDGTFQPLIESIVQGHLDRCRKNVGSNQYTHVPVDPTGDEELDVIIEEVSRSLGTEGDPLLFMNLQDIPEADQGRVTLIIKRLTRRLATRVSRRYRLSRKRRQIDLRRTTRANIRYGGVALKLKYKSRSVRKPRILLICDVSGSMIRYAGFVLQFIYGLSSVVDGIESFVFSEDLERITPYFQQRKPFEDTMEAVMQQSHEWGRGTNLSTALASFMSQYQHLLAPRTLVIIVSDTKTLAVDEAERGLREIGQRVKEILWLNTVPREDWSHLPSVAAFQKHCHMYECHTLAHLDRIMRHHVLAS